MLNRRQPLKHLTLIDDTAVMPWKNRPQGGSRTTFRHRSSTPERCARAVHLLLQQIEIEMKKLFSFTICPNTTGTAMPEHDLGPSPYRAKTQLQLVAREKQVFWFSVTS